MSAGWDFSDKIAFASLIVAVVGVGVPLALHYSRSIDYHERHLREDPTYRAETAAKLRSAKPGTLYRDALATVLDWLDRRWGVPNSAQALGVCTVISLCYAWVAFYLAYALGAPGRLGGFAFGPDFDQSGRTAASLLAILLPVGAFVFGRWLDQMERRCNARGLHRGRRQNIRRTRQALVRRYGLASAIIAAVAVGALTAGYFAGISTARSILVHVLSAAGSVVGLTATHRLAHPWLRGPGAAIAGGAVSLFVTVAAVAAEAGAMGGIG